MWRLIVSVVVGVCLGLAGAAQAGELSFEITQSPMGYRAGINVIQDGVTGVQISPSGAGAWESFDGEDNDFFINSDWYDTLSDLGDEFNGSFDLLISRGTDQSLYTFNLAVPSESAFAPLPQLTAPLTSPVGQSVNFTWTWSPAGAYTWDMLAGIFVDAWQEDSDFSDSSFAFLGGSMSKTDTSWHVNFAGTGESEMKVGYVTMVDGVVTDLTFVAGSSDFQAFDFTSGDDFYQVTIAGDGTQFEVVPEPASLALLAAGGVWLLSRRRTSAC